MGCGRNRAAATGILDSFVNQPEVLSRLSFHVLQDGRLAESFSEIHHLLGKDAAYVFEYFGREGAAAVDTLPEVLAGIRRSGIRNKELIEELLTNRESHLVAIDMPDISILNRLKIKINSTGGEFELIYRDSEVLRITKKGRDLGLDYETIEDLIFVGSRRKKPIAPDELIQQMRNYTEIVSKRGYPYLFRNAEQFRSFSIDLKRILQEHSIPTFDVRIQGSSLRTPQANDIDIAVFVPKEKFDELAEGMIRGIEERAGNPFAANNIIKALQQQIREGRINSFYFNRLDGRTFNQLLHDLLVYLPEGKGINLSLILRDRSFDVRPYLGL